jgi:hypothetical protein
MSGLRVNQELNSPNYKPRVYWPYSGVVGREQFA